MKAYPYTHHKLMQEGGSYSSQLNSQHRKFFSNRIKVFLEYEKIMNILYNAFHLQSMLSSVSSIWILGLKDKVLNFHTLGTSHVSFFIVNSKPSWTKGFVIQAKSHMRHYLIGLYFFHGLNMHSFLNFSWSFTFCRLFSF